MPAKVVCISRTLAAGGAEVGRLVAQQLGFRYLDDEIIKLASEKAHVDHASLEAVEHRPRLISRILDIVADFATPNPVSTLGLGREVADLAVTPEAVPAREEGRRLIREVIGELGRQGSAVIVAHAASIPLAGLDGLLRVLITAPEALRARRLELEVRIVSEAESLKTIRDSDRARLHYLRDFYGISEETPMLYDLVINTEALTYDAAAAIVVNAARGIASQ